GSARSTAEHLEGSFADITPSRVRNSKVDGDRRARSSPGLLTPSACATRTGDCAYRMDGTTQTKSSAREPISSGKQPSPSHRCEGTPVAQATHGEPDAGK